MNKYLSICYLLLVSLQGLKMAVLTILFSFIVVWGERMH